MKSIIVRGALALFVSSLAACGGDDDGDEGGAIPFISYATGEDVAGTTTTITRTDEGVTTQSHVILPADQEGMVFSYWYIMFDRPEECESSPCEPPDFAADRGAPSGIRFDGWVLDSSLAFDFSQTRTIADGPPDPEGNGDIVPGTEAHGLTDPMGAEIHVVVRAHGPPLEDFETQIGSLNGGCPPNTCENVCYAIHSAAN